MAEVQYVEIDAHIGVFERKGSLRDYSFDTKEGVKTVDFNKKIGAPVADKSKYKLIFPLQSQKDSKGSDWYQVINSDGVTGYIRGSHLDATKLSAVKSGAVTPQKLETPYRYFATVQHKTVYEREHNIFHCSDKEYTAAKEKLADMEMAKKYFKDVEKWSDADISDVTKAYEYVRSTYEDPERKAKIKAFCDKNHISTDAFTDAVTNISMVNQMGVNSLGSGLPASAVKFDASKGMLETSIDPQEMNNFRIGYAKNGIISRERKNGEVFNSSKALQENEKEFAFAVRAHAEAVAVERFEYRKDKSSKIECPLALSESIASDKKAKEIESQIEKKDFAGLFAKQVKEHGGICFGENHGRKAPERSFLAAQMGTLKRSGINTIYLEHCFQGKMQDMMDEYFQTGTMPKGLERFLNIESNQGLEDIVTKARENGVRIVGIGTKEGLTPTNFDRIRDFNTNAASIIADDQQKQTDKGYLIFAGTAHFVFHEKEHEDGVHPWETKSGEKVLPGLSKMLGKDGLQTIAMDKQTKDIIRVNPKSITKIDGHSNVRVAVPDDRMAIITDSTALNKRETGKSQSATKTMHDRRMLKHVEKTSKETSKEEQAPEKLSVKEKIALYSGKK